MPLALICMNPLSVLQVYDSDSANIDLFGEWQAQGVTAGWQSGDGLYKLVAFTKFVPPRGKAITGSARYTVDASGNVTETYNIIELH